VVHHSRLNVIAIDVPSADHDRELDFWRAATGQPLTQIERHPAYHGAALPGTQIMLLVQRLGDGPARMHVDIHTDNLAAEVARLKALGAEQVDVGQESSWQVMRDPAGLLFCVVPDPPGTPIPENSHRWE
jgi:hypothetical protein